MNQKNTTTKKQSQTETVLKHLNNRGSISPMEALVSYGITRLADNIYRLRNEGYNIGTVMSQDEAGHKYARYHLSYPTKW
jgi:hypothetical protein